MDKEKVLSLPVVDFFGYLAAIRKREEEEFNRQLKISAFTGWQQYTLLAGSFGGEKAEIMSFMEYSETLGILTKEEKEYLNLYRQMQKLADQNKAKQNIEKAKNIIELDRKNRRKQAERG